MHFCGVEDLMQWLSFHFLATCSFFRIGSIILALHDASDVFMEAAKVFKYSEKELAASVLFGFFAFSWLILRLIFFPFWVIRSSRSALMVNRFIKPNLHVEWLWLIFSYGWYFPAMTLLTAWIYRSLLPELCTMCSIQCYWCCLCSTYTGGLWYVQW